MNTLKHLSPALLAIALGVGTLTAAPAPLFAQATTQAAPVQNTGTEQDQLKKEEKANQQQAKSDKAQRKALKQQDKAAKAARKAGTPAPATQPTTTPQ